MENIIQYLDSIFINGLLNGSITIVITTIILYIINRILNKLIKKRWPNSLYIAIRVKRIIIYSIALVTIFMQIQPLQSFATTLLASGGILAIVIGLASQEAAKDLISGIMIFTYKPYVIGNYISITQQNLKGQVLDISLHHTVMETMEKTQIIVPNTIMNNATIENISNVPNKKANYLLIDISHDSDMDSAIRIIQEQACKHSLCVDTRTAKQKKQNIEVVPVFCIDLRSNRVSLQATIFSRDSHTGFRMLSDLRKSIKREFNEQGISMSYPQPASIPQGNK